MSGKLNHVLAFAVVALLSAVFAAADFPFLRRNGRGGDPYANPSLVFDLPHQPPHRRPPGGKVLDPVEAFLNTEPVSIMGMPQHLNAPKFHLDDTTLTKFSRHAERGAKRTVAYAERLHGRNKDKDGVQDTTARRGADGRVTVERHRRNYCYREAVETCPPRVAFMNFAGFTSCIAQQAERHSRKCVAWAATWGDCGEELTRHCGLLDPVRAAQCLQAQESVVSPRCMNSPFAAALGDAMDVFEVRIAALPPRGPASDNLIADFLRVFSHLHMKAAQGPQDTTFDQFESGSPLDSATPPSAADPTTVASGEAAAMSDALKDAAGVNEDANTEAEVAAAAAAGAKDKNKRTGVATESEDDGDW
jgi:hypothetical protein